MTETQKTDYPRYAFLADLSWFSHIRYFGTWNLVTTHHDTAKATFERLMALPEHREMHIHENTMLWQQQIAEGTLTAAQLHHQLYDERGGGTYEPTPNWGGRRERIRLDQECKHKADKIVDRVLHAREYPSITAAFDFGGLHLIARPAGITDELCYEFVSARTAKGWKRRLEAIRIMAHADAYLLERPNIIVHLHARNDTMETVITEKSDFALGHQFLESAEKMLQDIAQFHDEMEARQKARRIQGLHTISIATPQPNSSTPATCGLPTWYGSRRSRWQCGGTWSSARTTCRSR